MMQLINKPPANGACRASNVQKAPLSWPQGKKHWKMVANDKVQRPMTIAKKLLRVEKTTAVIILRGFNVATASEHTLPDTALCNINAGRLGEKG